MGPHVYLEHVSCNRVAGSGPTLWAAKRQLFRQGPTPRGVSLVFCVRYVFVLFFMFVSFLINFAPLCFLFVLFCFAVVSLHRFLVLFVLCSCSIRFMFAFLRFFLLRRVSFSSQMCMGGGAYAASFRMRKTKRYFQHEPTPCVLALISALLLVACGSQAATTPRCLFGSAMCGVGCAGFRLEWWTCIDTQK